MLTAVILLVALPITAFADPSTEPPYEIGDVNRDETLDMFDYLLIKSIYFEEYIPDEAQEELADINGDNSIDMFDYLLIKRAYFTGTAIVPPEQSEWNGTDNGERFGFIEDDQRKIHVSGASMSTSSFLYSFELWERTEDLLRYEFHIYDITTGKPVENVYYKHYVKDYIHSDENGILVLNAFFDKQGGTHVTLCCDGYKDKVVILSAPGVQDVHTVYMYPEEE